jgi:hypothetical protein
VKRIAPFVVALSLILGARAARADTCVIGGAVYASGAVNPSNICQACIPSSSTTAWSPQNDFLSCGAGVLCYEGSCVSGCKLDLGIVPPGTYFDDGQFCTVCNPAISTGLFSDVPAGQPCGPAQSSLPGVCNGSGLCLVNGCFIGGTLYTYGEENPLNTCQICNGNPNAWSAQPIGTMCGTGTGGSSTSTSSSSSGAGTGGSSVTTTTISSSGAGTGGSSTGSSAGSGGGPAGGDVVIRGSCQIRDEGPAPGTWLLGGLPLLLLRRRRSTTGACRAG